MKFYCNDCVSGMVLGLSIGIPAIICVVFVIILFVAWQYKLRQRADEYLSVLLVNYKDIIDDPRGKPPLFMNKVSLCSQQSTRTCI